MSAPVVVTGAGGAIGSAIVETLLAKSFEVVPVDRSEGTVHGRPIRAVDITDEDSVIALFASMAGTGVGGVVNAAGVNIRASALECSKETFVRNLDVNLVGTFLVCREAARLMGSNGGSIVNIASVIAFAGSNRQQTPYAASKGGVVSLTYTLAIEWAHLGIRVNAIAPAFVDTPMNAVVMQDADKARAVLDSIPLGRYGTPTDMANAAAWLLSTESGFVTGDVLRVDGGYLAR